MERQTRPTVQSSIAGRHSRSRQTQDKSALPPFSKIESEPYGKAMEPALRRSKMRSATGTTRSIWMGAAEDRRRAELDGNTHTNVCVVGGGISGLTASYQLVCSGMSVIVIEAGEIGVGEPTRTFRYSGSHPDRAISVGPSPCRAIHVWEVSGVARTIPRGVFCPSSC